MVLRKALSRLNPRTNSVRDMDRPPMTEYQALLIDRNDRDVFEFFVNETIRANPGISATLQHMVRGRAQTIVSQASVFNNHTLVGLERLVKTAKNLPGRKFVFFQAVF